MTIYHTSQELLFLTSLCFSDFCTTVFLFSLKTVKTNFLLVSALFMAQNVEAVLLAKNLQV